MSVNIRLGNEVISGVGYVNFEDADNSGTWDKFALYKKPIDPDADVLFYDYDGTILYSYSKAEFLALTAMPSNPTHEGLTAQGWNWTLADAQTYVTNYGMCDIGQLYITDDGKTRYYITLGNGNLEWYIRFSQDVSNGVIVDWGDGSATETRTGAYTDTMTHTYSKSGDYVVTLAPIQNCTLTLVQLNGSGIIDYAGACVKKIFVGTQTKIEGFCNYLSCLSVVTIPRDVQVNYGGSTVGFGETYSLSTLIFPPVINNYGGYLTRNAQHLRVFSSPNYLGIGNSFMSRQINLKRLCLNGSLTYLPDNFLADTHNLKTVICSFTTDIGSSDFSSCFNLTTFTIPSGCTYIGSSAFNRCFSLSDVYVYPQNPPTLANSYCFQGVNAKFHVPAASLDSYKSATNWSSFASQMVGDL